MSRSAKVTSIDMLPLLAAALQKFRGEGMNALDDLETELRRLLEWIAVRLYCAPIQFVCVFAFEGWVVGDLRTVRHWPCCIHPSNRVWRRLPWSSYWWSLRSIAQFQ